MPERIRGDMGRTVARNIRTYRVRHGLTQGGLSRLLLTEAGHNLHSTGIAKVERRERRVDVDDLAALAKVFAVDISELLREPESTIDSPQESQQ